MHSTGTTRSVTSPMHRPVTPSTRCGRTLFTAPLQKYRAFMEKCMKRPSGSPRPYLASSATENKLVANFEHGLHSVLTTLEGCRAVLTDRADRETAQLLSVAILQLRMKLHHVADSE